MKMVMAIVEREETARVMEALITGGYTATFTEGRSGVLRQAKQTLFIGVEASKLDDVLSIIQHNCRSHVSSTEAEAKADAGIGLPMPPRRTMAEVGSAVVFVWDIDRFETY